MGRRRAVWPLLALLTGLNILNFVDRQLLPTLAPLIIADLGLSRADVGLLVGFTFVVIYASAGMALGLAADRWPRRWLVAGGLALWSGMTAVSGAARSFAQLAAPRILVGVGESALTPCALSMLGDVVPARRLGLATSVYYAGLPLGTAISLGVAGWMAPRFGWRMCFYLIGLIGLAAVAAVFLVDEPRSRGPAATTAAVTPPSMVGLVREFAAAVRTRPSLLLVMIGGAALAYGSASATHGITWLVEERHFAYSTAAYTAGAMSVAAGLAGNAMGGWFSDWCARRWKGGRSWSLVLITIALSPFSLAFFTLRPESASAFFYVCWFVNFASQTAYFGPLYAAIQELSPLSVRSSVVALGILTVNILGVGPGPWVTGAIGDRLSLTLGLAVSVGVGLAAVVPFSLAARASARSAPR